MDVVIIGGGWGGLFLLKHCLEENLTCLLLEKSSEYGGVWNLNNSPSVYPNTYSVTSKHYLSISDFPIPDEYPEFPHHSLVYQYMKSFVEHFGLEKCISLDSNVERIKKVNDRWSVVYSKDGFHQMAEGKRIAICTGQNSRCIQMPQIDYSKFEGTVIHANDYNESFRKQHCVHKRVLVYGGSDTGADIADELTNNMYSKDEQTKVILSFKKGRWIQRRSLGSNAADMFYNRAGDAIIKNLSHFFGKSFIANEFIVKSQRNWWGEGGSNVKEWKPQTGYLNSYYIKSANIVNKVSLGEIVPKGNIVSISEQSVRFIDGSEENVDTIIFATGYDGMNCMYEIPTSIKKGDFFNHIFLIKDPTVVKIGFIRPYLTSIPMLIEMQTRYVAKVFSNKVRLPSAHDMQKDYETMKTKQSEEFSYDYERVQGIVDPYDYMHSLASEIGAVPSPFMPFELWKIVFLGSWSPYYYMLNHPDEKKREIAKTELMKLKDHPTSQSITREALKRISEMMGVLILVTLLIFFAVRYFSLKKVMDSLQKYRGKMKVKK